ncbi:MAG: nucleoid-associated protein [Bacteroidetes bacterium]|nr:nucleoid-associated protein [Bacteroidota bacterium]
MSSIFSLNDISIDALATQYIGNKVAGEALQLCTEKVNIDSPILKQVLLQYFLTPFREAGSYHLWHPADLNLNEVFHFVNKIFEQPDSFLFQANNIARHLYDITNLPQIKSGELHVVHFRNCPVNGVLTDAVGIYKTESKANYLKLEEIKGQYQFSSDEGINPEKMDKGCIIFNRQIENGYIVHVVDRTTKGGEAQFWKDQFLKIKAADDEYHATEDYIQLCKEFIVQQIPSEYEVERVQQIEMLNSSVNYFKRNENFDKGQFVEQVFGDEALIQSFRKYEKQFEETHDRTFESNFEISEAAVKKNTRALKSVLKLDKNFHIYVHGNRERIERGFDEESGLHFYKVFFEEEH